MSLKKIQQLRNITSLGIMECKEALLNANGNVDKAIEDLYSKGTIKYVKKDSQKLGFVNVVLNEAKDNAVIIEFNTQTDFVAKNEQFLSFVKNVTKKALEKKIKNIETLINEIIDGKRIEKHQSILVNQFKENIHISRLKYIDIKKGILGSYNINKSIQKEIGRNKELLKKMMIFEFMKMILLYKQKIIIN